VTRDRALGWLALAVGLGLALAVQVWEPVGVPLYDGVVVAEPYRYLHPTGSDQAGDPTSAEATKAVDAAFSPVIVLATTEQPPQAQLIAQNDAFELPAGTTELRISITAVDPEAQPTSGSIAGNVYRVAITNQDGTPVTAKPCGTCRSIILRAPEGVAEGTIGHLENGAWITVETTHAGVVGMFQVNATGLGDFAVLSGTGPPGSGGGLDPLLFGGFALAVFFVAVAALFWYRRRPPPVPVARLGPGRGRVPSKRRGPRRPPSGRSGS